MSTSSYGCCRKGFCSGFPSGFCGRFGEFGGSVGLGLYGDVLARIWYFCLSGMVGTTAFCSALLRCGEVDLCRQKEKQFLCWV